MEGIISTKPDRCRRCYGCIRECPAKAIRVVNGQALVMQDRCIACGHCVKVCSQEAKQVSSIGFAELKQMFAQGPVAVMSAPSYAASWPDNFRKLPSALKALGFTYVTETAFGADLISPLYEEQVRKNNSGVIISSSCPAVCNYIEKYFPELVPKLAGIISPMMAMGTYLKEIYGSDLKTVFIGPCTAKKAEIIDDNHNSPVDAVLTFAEIKKFFSDASIDIDELEESNFDPPHANLGKAYPLAGGLLKTASLPADVLEKEIIVVEGKGKVIEIIDELSRNQINAKFIDILFCEGCISGPAIDSTLNYYSRREKVIESIHDSLRQVDKKVWMSNLYNSRELNLSRTFTAKEIFSPVPDNEELKGVLASINKHSDNDRLNCGACGYLTCREFAVSVSQGLAEREMCLPFLIDELQHAYEHLRATQEQLASAEKLASIGQLAAGIAHEINNPLGTIMLYASLIQKQIAKLETAEGSGEDLKTIISEANRCKNIVANLLNFARQGKLALQHIDLFDLLSGIIRKLKPGENFTGIKVSVQLEANDSGIEADKDQLEQVFQNMLINAAEAMDGREIKKITVTIEDSADSLLVRLSDTGCGIPKENAGKIFTPFFTTKKIGKGTGLGMAIAYGIVKMHRGEIHFESRQGEGTTFLVRLPRALSPAETMIS